ncbi:MAG: hypothetical protein IPM92_00850 [Saprospiraceae bacterium]|nr:hypothetical protein [Saprospiraceae bacterium]
MKKKFIYLFALVFTLNMGYSQSNQSVYAELLGNGLIFSFNYDTRFTAKPTGIGGRAGLGYIGKGDNGAVLIPFQLNWLLGKNGKYFELGLGATYVGGTEEFFEEDIDHFVGTMTFGYRRQPEDGGFMWKAAITPVLADGFFWPYYVGFSLGYAF